MFRTTPCPEFVKEAMSPLFEKARTLVIQEKIASIAFLQRHLRVDYRRACSLMDELQQAGVVGPLDRSGARKVLSTAIT